jgi:hypothetical protein
MPPLSTLLCSLAAFSALSATMAAPAPIPDAAPIANPEGTSSHFSTAVHLTCVLNTNSKTYNADLRPYYKHGYFGGRPVTNAGTTDTISLYLRMFKAYYGGVSDPYIP